MEIQKLLDQYQQRKAQREKRLNDFFLAGTQKFLISHRYVAPIYENCMSKEDSLKGNLLCVQNALDIEWTDALPFLEPWIGTGVYANAFGCDYFFRDYDAPATKCRYHQIDQIRNLPDPDYAKSPIMCQVLEYIDYFKEQTRGQIPICLTDTQSAFDTATLIVDPSEFFVACYENEDIVFGFMEQINKLIIEFSEIQAKRIGNELLMKPGHLMIGSTGYRGIAVSDDNLAICSPEINEKISMPFNQKLADRFDGIAIHSCGSWSKTMKVLRKYERIIMIDCAVNDKVDPNPNSVMEVKKAIKGTGIILKIRIKGEVDELLQIVDQIADPEIQLIVDIVPLDDNEKQLEMNYKQIEEKLGQIYQ